MIMMQQMKRSFFAFLSLLLLLSSCAFDKEEVIFPEDPLKNCDTLNVSYAATVKPVMDTQCATCHSLSLATGGVVLEQYSDVKPYADSGQLVSVLEYNSEIKMPTTGKLPLCDIAKIRSWVRDGALDN